MPIQLIQKIAGKIKQESYDIDKSISNRDIFYFTLKRIIMLLRGFIFMRRNVFLGKRVDIYFKNHIVFGKYVSIQDGVEIDALSKNGIKMGNNVSIGKNSYIKCTSTLKELGDGLTIADNVGIGSNSYLGCWGGIKIDKNTITGERLTIHSDNHEFSEKSILIRHQGMNKRSVKIGENCWIGSNVTLLGGVQIGNGCVVGAGAVVTKSVPENSIVVGNPAKVIRSR